MQRTTVDGKRVLLRVQGTTFVNGQSNTIRNVFDPKTMAPITSETHGIDGSILRRTFTGTHVVTETLASAKDPATKTQADLSVAPYDFNGGLYGLLLAALPLKAGFAGTLPAIADRENTLTSEPFRVLRQESVSAGSRGMVKAWVVETGHPGGLPHDVLADETASVHHQARRRHRVEQAGPDLDHALSAAHAVFARGCPRRLAGAAQDARLYLLRRPRSRRGARGHDRHALRVRPPRAAPGERAGSGFPRLDPFQKPETQHHRGRELGPALRRGDFEGAVVCVNRDRDGGRRDADGRGQPRAVERRPRQRLVLSHDWDRTLSWACLFTGR